LRLRLGASKEASLAQKKKSDLPPKQVQNKGTTNKADQPLPSKPTSPKVKEADKKPIPFSIEHELSKVNIHESLTELLKNDPFNNSIMKVLKPPDVSMTSDVITLQDENPAITVGPHIKDWSDASPPFYISLNVHGKILQNCLMLQGPPIISFLKF
jgi:hypothetical protein